MTRCFHFLCAVIFLQSLLAGATASYAQTVLELPEESQRAMIVQRIGLTDIAISYHRPLVHRRPIWGVLIPYGEIWRAGANENTTIEFSDSVTVEDVPLPKGIYGLHVIPEKNEWTLIFSKNSSSWGSFAYDRAEDALRISVKPHEAEFHEALTYDFKEVEPDSTIITLVWENLGGDFKVKVNVNEIVAQRLQNQLRGSLGDLLWNSWNEAASYLLSNKGDLNTALKYANRSIVKEERFENLMIKALILDSLGHTEEATMTKKRAIESASAAQLHVYGRRLLFNGKQDQAFEFFRLNISRYPNDWTARSDAARLACARHDFDAAVKEMKAALALAPDLAKPSLQSLVMQLELKTDINK